MNMPSSYKIKRKKVNQLIWFIVITKVNLVVLNKMAPNDICWRHMQTNMLQVQFRSEEYDAWK